MKPFDLDRAKAGDGVFWVRPDSAVQQVHFVGIEKSGFCVVQTSGFSALAHGINIVKTMDLRMAPKKVTRWVNFYGFGDARYFHSEEYAKQSALNRDDLVAAAVPVEIEE